MTAVINNFGGFYQTRVYVNEARKAGADVNLPCVNKSNYHSTICGKAIYLGFIHITSLEGTVSKKIETERELSGNYQSIEDFINRIPITVEQLIILIRINAFRFTGKAKKQLLWEAHLILGKSRSKPAAKALFHAPCQEYTFPNLAHKPIEDAYDELELLGFTVSVSPFDMLRTAFRGETPVKNLIAHVGKQIRMLGYFVANKQVRTIKGGNMNFGTFLDVNSDFFDTTHFPDQLRNYPFRGTGVYLIAGKVVEEFGFPSIEVEKMARLPVQQDPRVT
jgi:DNA polymerase III alpha subunit